MGRDLRMSRAREIKNRAHPLWLAYIVHRVSGLGLALFLPFHFWILALSLTNPERLDGFLKLTEQTVVKLAEYGLVLLLAIHMFGGLRLMALEWLPWTPSQKTLAAVATALAFLIATLFFLAAL